MLHPRFPSVESPWLETTHFQKSMYMHDVLCNVIDRIMYAQRWFCGHNDGALYAYVYMIQHIHTFMCVIPVVCVTNKRG